MLVAIGTISIGVSTAFAQEQERRLIDRVLKPNTELANPVQNKKFSDKRFASFDKPVRTRTFNYSQKPTAKTFSEEHAFPTNQFTARHFRAGDSAAYIASRSQPPKNDTLIATPSATGGTRVASENNAPAPPVREYASTRPFLDKGKSEKSLHAQNPPLTIDQVRELLNKSK